MVSWLQIVAQDGICFFCMLCSKEIKFHPSREPSSLHSCHLGGRAVDTCIFHVALATNDHTLLARCRNFAVGSCAGDIKYCS